MGSEERAKEILKKSRKALLGYDEDKVKESAQTALDEGVDPFVATMEGLAEGMMEMGDLYDRNDYFVLEILLCAEILYTGLDILRPAIKTSGSESEAKGSIILGVVEGDFHDIGKNQDH